MRKLPKKLGKLPRRTRLMKKVLKVLIRASGRMKMTRKMTKTVIEIKMKEALT